MPSTRLSPGFFVVGLAALFLFLGCADTVNTGIDWKQRIGNYTFADMVDDFGRPWATQTNSDYSKTCQWPFYSGHDTRIYTKVHGRDLEFSSSKDPNIKLQYYYQMTFNSNGTLIKWKEVKP